MKLSKREKILLAIVAVLALGAVYYFYFLTPYFAEMAEIKKNTDTVKVEVDMLNMQKSQLKVLDDQIAELQSENKALLEKLPVGFDQPEVLQFLQQTIKEHGSKTGFSFDLPLDFQKIDSMRAMLDFKTDYANLKEILKALNTCPYNNRIISLTATTEIPAANPIYATEGTGEETNGTDEQDALEPLEYETVTIAAPETSKYDMQVLLTIEFFNSKGEIPVDKTYDFDTGLKGKADLFD